MELFWPDSGMSSARNCLNVTLHQVRSSFQEVAGDVPIIQFKDDCYCINQDIEITRDIDAFKSHWRHAKTFDNEKKHLQALPEYEMAAAMYKGDFMEDELYERWIETERESLKESYLLILDRISYFYSTNGKPDVAVDLCYQILKKDDCREDIHRRLMKCFFRVGQPQRALKQFEKCVKALNDELEVKPTKKTYELYEMIKNRMN
jgi:DNA-binding SARP family transcriptional activator